MTPIYALRQRRHVSPATASPTHASWRDQSAQVRHILRSPAIQPKLKIGAPNDQYEREADRVADTVMRMTEPGLRRQTGEAEEKELPQARSLVQRRVNGAGASGAAPPIVDEVLRSQGKPLDTATQHFMGSRFGHDFSRVRIHTDGRAAASVGAVSARAYTVGQDVVFGAGHYAPDTDSGRRLLAHELTHVVQQRVSLTNGPRPATAEPETNALEAGARRRGPVINGQAEPGVQRSPGWDSDEIGISFTPLEPKTPPQMSYNENGFLSQRMSTNLPQYKGPFCQNVTLPFKSEVEFRVDVLNDPRPRPFTPPKVSVAFEFSPPGGGFKFAKSDKSPGYVGQDKPLKTSFGSRFDFDLSDNGPFTMKFELHDPDTGITRRYQDRIDVEAKRPCV